MKKLFTLFAGMIIASAAWADDSDLYEPMIVESGFNRDVIAESWANFGAATVQSYYDTLPSIKYSYATVTTMRESGKYSKTNTDPETTGFPDDGRIVCLSQQTYPGLYWQMAPYCDSDGGLSPNALCIRLKNKGGLPDNGRFVFKILVAIRNCISW